MARHQGSQRWEHGLLAVLLVCASSFAAVGPAPAQSWKPERNVELVVGSGPGGSADNTIRTVQKILQDKRLLEMWSVVVNKPGAGGAISWSYLNQHVGDGHYIAITFPNILTNYITGVNPLRYSELTPLAQLSSDYIAFVVRADSPIASGKDLAERLRKEPAATSIAFATARGNAPHMAMGLAMKAAGVDVTKLKFVVFKSGGEVIPALLGGHVDLIITSPSVVASQMPAGNIRIIAVSAPQRLGGAFAAVPTWREQGIDAVFANWRGMIGPRGMTAGQIAYWDSVFAKLSQSEDWKRELEKHLWNDTYLNSAETRRFLDAHAEELKVILTDLGVIK